MSSLSSVAENPRAAGLADVLGTVRARFSNASLFFLLLALVVFVRLHSPGYWSGSNGRAIMLAAAIPVVLAVTQLVVILAGNFDISVGSTLGLSAMSVGFIYHAHPHMAAWLGFVIATAIGALVGTVNGVLVAYLRIPSIVLTLGTLSVISGVTYRVAHGQQVNPDFVSHAYVRVSLTSPIRVPGIVLIAVAVACLVAAGLRWTRFGRTIFALGSNSDAARLQGLPVRKVEVATFVLSGAGAGLAGGIYLSQYQLVNLFSGSGLGFQAITIVIVGGASVLGGAGTVVGTLVSALLIDAMGNGLAVLGLSSYWQGIAFGALLLLAVALNARTRRVEAQRALIRPELTL